MNANNQSSKPIILFDGVCNLCEGFVQFVIKNEKEPTFYFASLQSDYSKQILQSFNVEQKLKTVIFIKDGKVFTKSDAALEISRGLRFPLNGAYFLKIVPSFIRNWVYNWVSRNRYYWFGKKSACMVPTPELQQRFLD